MECVRCHQKMNTDTAELNAYHYGSNYYACEHCGMLYTVYRPETIAIDPIPAFIKEDDWGKEVVSDEEYYNNLKKCMTINFDICSEDAIELKLGNYEIEVRDGKTYAIKKKPVYPKTYDECYDEYNTELHFIYVDKDERDLYESFIQLIRCRNAYWKIAGEQMGLDEIWKPDWNDLNRKYFISLTCDGIGLYDDFRNPQVLAFPTAEIRDAFYENFKDLIEKCKELL